MLPPFSGGRPVYNASNYFLSTIRINLQPPMASPRRAGAYKEITLQQLRSFCETARLGSFKAAASSLGLAHPTIWQQVHALERELDAQLVEPHGRGCRLTEEGRL